MNDLFNQSLPASGRLPLSCKGREYHTKKSFPKFLNIYYSYFNKEIVFVCWKPDYSFYRFLSFGLFYHFLTGL